MASTHRTVLLGGVAALALTATVTVSAVGPTGSFLSPAPAAAATGLQAFDDCTELADWYVEAALEEVTAYGLGEYGYLLDDTVMRATVDLEAADGASAPVSNGATGTNVQEAGVDEPDIAKTDGSHTYVVRNLTLTVTDVTGDEPVVLAELDLPRELHQAELLLVGDRLVLIASGYTYGGGGPFGSAASDRGYYGGSQYTHVGIADVSDPSSPVLESERTVEGDNVSARERDGTVRLVVGGTPNLDFVYPDRGTTRREALAENRRIVRETTAQDWLPQQRIGDEGPQPLLDCAEVTRPRRQAGLGTVSVLTFDPRTDDVDALAVAAGGALVYSSLERLYVATSESDGWLSPAIRVMRDGVRAAPNTTGIHAFDVSGDTTTYVASGRVPGTTPDRWSFSEHEGRLRVASMLGNSWRPRESAVTVLEENGVRLEQVGSVAGMGRGERIESVRWFDDLAVLVTFRQVDPLYTVDLSDPQAPQVLGELKIPGFSAYLHPIGDDLLLGVGQDADRRGWSRSSQVSSFDLSDLATPTRVAALDLGDRMSSPVEDDARAFTYLPDQRLALVPVSGYGQGSRMAVVGVGADGALDEAVFLDLPGRSGYDVRALPLSDGRVAIVGAGDVLELFDPSR